MLTIIPDLTISSKEQTSLDYLLSAIDDKLAKIGKSVYEKVTYGMPHCDSVYTDLIMYKNILIQKKNGCGCYSRIPLKQIISKIKTLVA